MTELLEKALREIGKLAPADQDEVAGVMLEMIEQRQHGSLLTDEQQAEVRRRQSDPNQVRVSFEDAMKRISGFGFPK